MAFLFHFWQMKVCIEGEFYPANQPLLTVQNISYKWGDGLFETMKVCKGKILLEQLHFERLFASLKLLQIDKPQSFTTERLLANIIGLCKENDCLQSARVRLHIFRKEDNAAAYTIEAVPLDQQINQWKEEGWEIGLYPYARKSIDAFANLKAASFLPYTMAAKYAAENKLDDVVLLNAHQHLCDSSRANIFLIKKETVHTPGLHQGCVNGVMRRQTIEVIKKMGLRFYDEEVSEESLLEADEVFLTNAIQGIRWVKQYKHRNYSSTLTKKIFEAVSEAIY